LAIRRWLAIALLRIVDVGRVVIEGRQRADHAAHDRHRVRVAAEAAEEAMNLLVHHGVAGDACVEVAFCAWVGSSPFSSR
jgi:fatty acid-binding protein DegV